MPTESSGASSDLVEADDYGPSRGSETYFDAGLGPGCMMWFMGTGLGVLILMILTWMVTNIGSIFR